MLTVYGFFFKLNLKNPCFFFICIAFEFFFERVKVRSHLKEEKGFCNKCLGLNRFFIKLKYLVIIFNFRLGKTRIAGIEPAHVILKTTVLPLNYIPLKTPRYWTLTTTVTYSIVLLSGNLCQVICISLTATLQFLSWFLSLATKMFPFANRDYLI